ncbi:DUF6612 family protein [Jeotgalibacillus soli]|uniref:Lipoprotein n=1 Tax=Jeotgalibacillus soli TaxID=889306 RepID=A0A0C2VIW9_9BACL|nr:DUF6612 family protein [Jeotgalibacillus soli]KIL43938.1 hypothetical protein KP78_37620 [Jeotgalibacillus soli]
MKKTAIIFTASFALLLAACSEPATPVENDNTAETEASSSDLTLEEVFAKTIEANENIESVSAEVTIDQIVSLPSEDTETNVTTVSQMDSIVDPIALYSVSERSFSGEELPEAADSMKTETYITEEGIFISDPTTDQWVKMPEEMSDMVLQATAAQGNLNDQIAQLQQFTDDFTFEQDDTSYILTLQASGEKFNEFIQQQTADMMPGRS